jgi:hypothetical protein
MRFFIWWIYRNCCCGCFVVERGEEDNMDDYLKILKSGEKEGK